MNPKELVRDAERIHGCLKELEDSRLVTTTGCTIYIPSRFAERDLAEIGIETHICGVYAIVVEDKYYGVSLVNAMMRIEPSSTLKIDIDGTEYFKFDFEPGSTVVSSTKLVKTDTLVYKIYDEIFSKGRVPWYVSYVDMGRLFDTAKKHAGANIGTNQEVTELLASMVARDPKDRHVYYRRIFKKAEDLVLNPPAFIPLRSVAYAATNTTNRLAGSYFDEGLTSALVNPTDRVERIESLLRM